MPLPADPIGIRAAVPGHFWFYTGLVCAAAAFGFFATWYFFRRLLLVEDTPRSMIRAAAQGYVELSGRGQLMPGEPIVAPLTRARCVWWSYKVEEYVHAGRSSHWSTLKTEVSDGLFLVVDGTGQCVVDPEGAEVYPAEKDVWYGDTAQPMEGPDTSRRSFFTLTTPNYRYTERRMPEGGQLYALGYFHTQGPPTSGDIDEEVRQQLMVWKRDQAWLLRNYDANHDGQVDQQEWEVARQDARRLVLEREREHLQRPPMNVLSRAPDGRAFILSGLSQKSLEGRLRLYALGSLLLFFAAGALAAYVITVRLG